MSTWFVFYAFGDTAHVLMMHSTAFVDAASIEDAVLEKLRASGPNPDLLTVFGPYVRVVTQHEFEPLRVVSRLQEIDEALAALDAARDRLRRRIRPGTSKE